MGGCVCLSYLCFVFFQLQKREINDKGEICVRRDVTFIRDEA